jgi:o-succinylbenzoate---CoA ligase
VSSGGGQGERDRGEQARDDGDRDELAADRALSIRAAAAEAPGAPALITREGVISFAEAAQAAALVRFPDNPASLSLPGGPSAAPSGATSAERSAGTSIGGVWAHPFEAERTVATVLAVYAALEARRPLGMVHPLQPERLQAAQADALAAHRVPEHTAFVLFTSGSTGSPRGVVLSRRAVAAAARAHAAHLPWQGGDRWLVALPLAHSGGLAAVIRCLAARKPIVLVEHDSQRELPPWPLADALTTSAATITSLVPAQLAALLDEGAGARFDPPPALRAILVGGAATAPSLRQRALERGLPILVTYGMTETFGQVATALAPHDAPSAIGPPLPGVTLRAGSRAQPATVEILGPTCMTGYLGEPPLPEPRVVTSDDGFLDELGHLHVVGRRDDIIITGGENVSPLAVEEELRRTPSVRDACVFGVADARWGQLVAAALVVEPSFSITEAIATWSQLPSSHRPRAIALVAQLPLGATGKVSRRAASLLERQLVTYP